MDVIDFKFGYVCPKFLFDGAGTNDNDWPIRIFCGLNQNM